MKYLVTKDGLLTKLYAVVGRDEAVVWNPQRNKATELDKEKAVRVANRFKNTEVVCAECNGHCDHILEALKLAVSA